LNKARDRPLGDNKALILVPPVLHETSGASWVTLMGEPEVEHGEKARQEVGLWRI